MHKEQIQASASHWIAVGAGLLLVACCVRTPLIFALMGSLAFASTAVVTLTELGDSSLAFMLFAFVLLLHVLVRRTTLDDLDFVFTDYRTAWIAMGLMFCVCIKCCFAAAVVRRPDQHLCSFYSPNHGGSTPSGGRQHHLDQLLRPRCVHVVGTQHSAPSSCQSEKDAAWSFCRVRSACGAGVGGSIR